jgi:hypothetical protein
MRAEFRVLISVDSAFLCENLCVLGGFCFLNLTAEKQTEDFAEDAEKIRI